MRALQYSSAIHLASVNSFSNDFLFFFCFLLYLWYYFQVIQRCTSTQVWNDGLGIELGFNFQQLLLFLWKAMLSTRRWNKKGSGTKLCPTLVSGIVTGDAPVTYWPIFLPVTSNWVPEVLTERGFLFVTKVTSIQVGHVAAAQKLKANWYATPNQKTMVNNELTLSKRTNQERPYKQLLHYRSRHLQVGPEQFCTSLFNQHLGVLVSFPEPYLHPKLPKVFSLQPKHPFPSPDLVYSETCISRKPY